MKVPKIGKLITAMSIILVSVLLLTQVGELCHAQNPIEDEDMLQKGRQLFTELKIEEAYGSYRVAWVLAATVDNNPERAMQALKGMGDCAFLIGAVDTCIYRYQKAASLAQKLNKPYEEYEIYSQLKQAYMAKVDMHNALLITQKIDSLYTNVADTRIKIGLQQLLAQEAIQQENPKLAEHHLLANEELLDSLTSEERQYTQFTVFGHLRDFYFGLQDFKKARKYSQLYIDAGKRGFKQQQMGYMTYDTEALICAQQNDRKASFEALDSMKYGLTLKNGASPMNVMHYYDVKGRVHAIFGEWEQSCDNLKKALAAVEDTHASNRIDYFRIVKCLGDVYFNAKQYDEARECYEEVGRYCKFQFSEESLAYADALWTLANFEGHCGEIKTGKQYYTSSVDICKRLVSSQLKYISVQERNSFWYSFAPKMFAMTAYAIKIGEQQSQFTEKCYETLLFSKALLLESDRTMADAISNNCTSDEQRIYHEMIGLQNQLKMLMNDYDKNKKRIETLHQKISALDKQLTPIISRLGYTSFLDQNYSDIKKSLNKDEVLLDFTDFVSDENIHQHVCFVINQEQQHPKLIKVFSEDAVKKLIKDKNIDWLYQPSISEKTLKLIWEPLKDEIQGKRAIFYVPSGLMHQISLESIPLKDGTLLGDHYHFVRLSSAREITKVDHQNNARTNINAILYGGLKYDVDTTQMANEASQYHVESLLAFNRGETVRGNGKFRELPNSKEEIDRIEVILKKSGVNVTPRTGTKGTEESFLSLSGNAPNILHIATHGFYYTPDKAKDVSYLKGYNDAMMLSGLIMSGGNRAWTGNQIPNGVQSGILTANTIANMNLKGTDLLVLSACQTGQGRATPEGLYGLQRAFKKAGVQTMVLTLWNINDKVAKDFMVKFYEELADNRDKWDKRKAFEKAKSYIRNNHQYHDPYYWAGFVMLD